MLYDNTCSWNRLKVTSLDVVNVICPSPLQLDALNRKNDCAIFNLNPSIPVHHIHYSHIHHTIIRQLGNFGGLRLLRHHWTYCFECDLEREHQAYLKLSVNGFSYVAIGSINRPFTQKGREIFKSIHLKIIDLLAICFNSSSLFMMILNIK